MSRPKPMKNPISGVELKKDFEFSQIHIDSVLHYLDISEKSNLFPTYKQNKIREHFSLKITSHAEILKFSDIYNDTKIGGKNTNQGQRNFKNPKEDEIKTALENQNRLDLNPMSVIKLKNKSLIDEYGGKYYVQGDGRTRRKIKENLFHREEDIFTVYELIDENKSSLKKALSFLTHAKNAENNNNVYAEQTRQHIIDAYVSDLIEGIIELDENLTYKDFKGERNRMKFTFGANTLLQNRQWTTTANSILDAALAKFKKESDNIGESDHAFWDREHTLPAWVSGDINQPDVAYVSRTPYKFKMAKYSENGELISRGRYVYFHDVNAQDAFLRMNTLRRKNWPSNSKLQTEEMKAAFEAVGRDITKENPNDYRMDIILYFPHIKASAVETSSTDIWSYYKKTLNTFMNFQFDLIHGILSLHVPNVDLNNTYVERYAGDDDDALVRIVGAMPSCTKFQYMDKIVKFNTNATNDRDRFFFDDSVEHNNMIPTSSSNKNIRRGNSKKEQESKEIAIDIAAYSMLND